MGDRPAQSVYNYVQLPGSWSAGSRRGRGGGRLVLVDCFPQLVFNCVLSSCIIQQLRCVGSNPDTQWAL